MKFWKSRRRAFGIGLGVGVAGAFALAFRYGWRRPTRLPLPEDLSPAIFARRMAQTSQGDLVYHVSGSGEPVVFLHGLYPGASSFEWSKVYPHFVMGREVVAADLLGFGESQRPDHGLDASDYAESLADLLLEVAPGRAPVLVASGMTCSLALLVAARHPERVSSLGLVMPQLLESRLSWAGRGLSLAARIPLAGRFLYDSALSREVFLRDWALRAGFADAAHLEDSMVRNLTICAQLPGASHTILNLLRGGLSREITSRLDRVPQRVVLLGSGDQPVGDAAVLYETLPSVSFVSLPPCRELAALEIPNVLAEALLPLLEGPSALEGAA